MSTETKSQTVTLDLGGMHCEHCAAAIERRLRKTEGIVDVSVDFPAATAEVSFDPERTEIDVLIAAIEDEGYEAKVRQASSPGA